MIPMDDGDIAVVFRADGRIETDFDHYGDPDADEEFVTELNPMYRALLVAVLFLPHDPELASLRERIYEISKAGPIMAPPEGELN